MAKLLLFLGLIIISHAFGFSNKKTEVNISQMNVKFYTLKSEYKKDERVCFVFENTSGKMLYLPSSAPWAVFSNDKPDSGIFSPLSAQVIVSLKDGEKKQWCWDQKDIEGKEVSVGDYFIRITFFDEKGEKYFKKLYFRIKF